MDQLKYLIHVKVATKFCTIALEISKPEFSDLISVRYEMDNPKTIVEQQIKKNTKLFKFTFR